MQEANLRSRQAEQQNIDATERNIVWAVEEANECDDHDAEGDDDPDYVRLPDGSYEKVTRRDLEPPVMVPIGVRNSSGEIVSLPDEIHFNGNPEVIPTCLDQVVRLRACGISRILTRIKDAQQGHRDIEY